ncbi:14642_t:CDS:1, partial [Dentiscutata erythropus]
TMNNYKEVDQVLIKRKWLLAFNLCLRESINRSILKYSSDAPHEIACLIEELKDYDDLYVVDFVDENKANDVWDG